MPVSLTDHALEQGSFLVSYTFKDLSGTDVIPKSASWTLTDKDGTIINDRENEDITGDDLAADIYITLQGDDLVLADPENNLRIVTIKGVFDDPSYGEDLPYRDEIRFYIDDLMIITN
jgi:hypothetical protein